MRLETVLGEQEPSDLFRVEGGPGERRESVVKPSPQFPWCEGHGSRNDRPHFLQGISLGEGRWTARFAVLLRWALLDLDGGRPPYRWVQSV